METDTYIRRNGMLAEIRPPEGGRILIFGDIHGDLQALKMGLELRRPEDVLVFLGDYADRGPEGVEVIEGIGMLVKKYPDRVVALKGNHEEYSSDGEPVFSPCTLMQEAERKRGGWKDFFESTFRGFIDGLSLAALVPGAALFVHGGVGKGIENHSSLHDPGEELQRDILWSDPSMERGISPNMRGAGKNFGEDVTEEIVSRLGVKRIIRSHEPRKAVYGPAFDHDGRVVTLSATSVYGGRPFLLSITAEELAESRSVDTINDSVLYLDETG